MLLKSTQERIINCLIFESSLCVLGQHRALSHLESMNVDRTKNILIIVSDL